jgi:uncharacterized protein
MRESLRSVLGSRAIRAGLLAVTLVFSWTGHAAEDAAKPDPEEAKLVRELITITGSDRIGTQVMDALLQQFQQAFTTVPADYWATLRKSLKSEELVELIVPIYAKNFTSAELKELISFYQSPIGKKVVATLPAISQESMVAGQSWGQKKAAEILEKLKADGYKPPQGT